MVVFCFCVCLYGFSCVYCTVFHWMDSPHCDLLWFTVIFCAIWSINHKAVLNFTWLDPLQLPILHRISSFMHPDSSKTLVLYKSCTFLLTIPYSYQWAIVSIRNIYILLNAQLLTERTFNNIMLTDFNIISQRKLENISTRTVTYYNDLLIPGVIPSWDFPQRLSPLQYMPRNSGISPCH